MRIHIKTTPAKEIVPFNYQKYLVGTLHKWLGDQNQWHDELSLYSLSWLSHGIPVKNKGLDFPTGAYFFISSPSQEFLMCLIQGIQEDPEIAFGLRVSELKIQAPPQFETVERFIAQSPILIKKRREEGGNKYFFPEDKQADQLLTETLRWKLKKGGFKHPRAIVRFDPNYRRYRTKVAVYDGIKNKGTLCPVIVEGSPEEIKFAWSVGIGSSTGIGFGALK
ncbi:CRISPR-associated endoribonuclease Cas6 [Pontibacter sp. G13]|uniref:CRISPR-associated endoribonuclease Cas6 n=1 Tax=Pontibacter sp. G13 TaxID=3074898 RepID=UPI00288AEED1|nr:CRISPR-associated endoribonuclease Cas6 [Pontibacter sp. G13]WNJ20031.1 CRISPR-associated endoribonuclease Cas6 [Pontibacter sp. G13]